MDPGFASTPEDAPESGTPIARSGDDRETARQGDEAMRIITDLEQRLARLRAIESDQDEQDAALGVQMEAIERERRDLEARSQALREREQAVESRSEQIAAREAARAAQLRELEERESAIQTRARAIETAAAEIETRGAQLDEREARINHDAQESRDAERERLANELDAAQRELAGAARSVETLTARLEAMERERDALRAELNAARTSREGVREGLALRQRRLRAVREALKSRAARILKARDALRKQARECEAVLKQRDGLEAEQRSLAQQRKRLSERLRRRDAGILFATFAVGLAALSVIAWSVATRVAPATYVALATLAPSNSQAADLNPDSAQAWRDATLALLEDPQLADVAVDRLKRRGVLEFASAGALAAALRTRLSAEATAPNRVRVAFQGKGAARTRLILDTILAAVVSIANDARRLGAQGLSTEARDRAAISAPVEDDRLIFAGALLGAAALPLALIAWLLASRARRVAATLDDDSAPLIA